MELENLRNRYSKEIEIAQSTVDNLKGKTHFFIISKLLVAISTIATIYFVFKNSENRTTILVALALLIVCYIALYYWDSKHMAFIHMLKERIRVCANELNCLKGDFSQFRNGIKFINSEHDFSYDLDVFGENSFFHRVNRTITEIGENILAEKFISLPNNQAEITDNFDTIEELKNLFEWRISFLSHDFIDFKPLRGSNIKISAFIQAFSKILVTITLLTFLLGVFKIIPMTLFVIFAIFQLTISIFYYKNVNKVGFVSEKIEKTFDGYSTILKKIEKQDFTSKKINEIKKILFSGKNNSAKSFKELSKLLNLHNQRGSAVMYVLLNGLFMIDIFIIDKFNKWNKKYSSHFDTWINCIAEIDALVSLATYSFNTPDATKAELIDENSSYVVEAEDVYHPFLILKSPVANSFKLERKNIAIITGANMAGKSTFLRTLGLNYILACIGVPVCAKSFKFSIMSLFSSMRTTDNLANDVSYFNAELLRIKTLLDKIQKNDFTFIILDEILKGTNSKDKLQGSVMFLKALEQYNISCIIATHDLELAKLEDNSTNGTYKNYCFEIELANNINYTYKISKGIAQNMNATYLLSNILSSTLS